MNKNKKKIEFFVLITIIISSLLYLIFSNGGQLFNYSLPLLSELEADSIDRILLSYRQSEYDLQKIDDQWRIQPQNFKGDATKIELLLNKLTKIQLLDLVSDRQDFANYGLSDDNSVSVSLYGQDKLLRQLNIGNSPTSAAYTYIKLPDDANIYNAVGSFANDFQIGDGELRDNVVLTVPRNDVIAIGWSGRDFAFNIIKNNDDQWLDNDGSEVNGEAVSALLGRLAELKCKQWLDNAEQPPPAAQQLTLTLDDGSNQHQMQIFSENDDGYLAVSSQSEFPFMINAYDGEQILKQLLLLVGSAEEDAAADLAATDENQLQTAVDNFSALSIPLP